MSATPPLVLIVLDGFGEAPAGPGNAITSADPAFWLGLRETYPFGLLEASGRDVGLPCGLMGNSEVGHLNIGAGRVVWQDITRIDRAIEDGSFHENEALLEPMAHARRHGKTLHLMGLVSDGEVHSSDRHLVELVKMALAHDVAEDRIAIHAFLDGRDTPPRSAPEHLGRLQAALDEVGGGRIASVIGRYWAMDRDKRWERVQKAYDCLSLGLGEQAETWAAALDASYAAGVGDEFVEPTVVGSRDRDRIRADDGVIFFNYRADRARQLSEAFLFDDFAGFPRASRRPVCFATMTRYRADFPCAAAFQAQHLKGHFGQVVSEAGLRQLRIAETEKYAHVTFFFSGGDEAELPGESRILIPSPRVATYDMQPEMSAVEVTDRLLAALDDPQCPDVVVLNYANADMVGHTGVFDAAVQSVRTLDGCLQRVVKAVLGRGGKVAITADHGNCEMMIDPDTGKVHTAHTTNPVPLLIAGEDLRGKSLRAGGRLCDIVPTLLPMLGLDPHPEMDGVNLL